MPSQTFNTLDEWLAWIDLEIITNGQELITGNDGNITENAAVKFIKRSPLNWEKALIVSTGGAVVAARPVLVFTTTTPTTLTWNDNIYNEYVFVNMTANAIPLLGSLVYYNTFGNPVNNIPANQAVNIVKSSNDLWVQSNNVLPFPLNGAAPDELDFKVTSSSIIPIGGSSLTIPDFIGYNLLFIRNGIPQYKTTLGDGSQYFSWNKNTGIFNLLPAGAQGQALDGELFLLMPCTGRGFILQPGTATIYPFVITSADFEVDGVTYLNPDIVGESLYLQANNTPNPFLFAPTDFIYVAGGIQIILAGFDANTFNYTIAINKLNS